MKILKCFRGSQKKESDPFPSAAPSDPTSSPENLLQAPQDLLWVPGRKTGNSDLFYSFFLNPVTMCRILSKMSRNQQQLCGWGPTMWGERTTKPWTKRSHLQQGSVSWATLPPPRGPHSPIKKSDDCPVIKSMGIVQYCGAVIDSTPDFYPPQLWNCKCLWIQPDVPWGWKAKSFLAGNHWLKKENVCRVQFFFSLSMCAHTDTHPPLTLSFTLSCIHTHTIHCHTYEWVYTHVSIHTCSHRTGPRLLLHTLT